MYQMLFKNRKVALGFVAFMIVSVIVLFSGDESALTRLTNAFGDHEDVAADESVAVQSAHPVEPEVIAPQPPEDEGFVDDEELVEDDEGDDPTPAEENIDGNDDGYSAEDDGYHGEQVIIVNPDAPGQG